MSNASNDSHGRDAPAGPHGGAPAGPPGGATAGPPGGATAGTHGVGDRSDDRGHDDHAHGDHAEGDEARGDVESRGPVDPMAWGAGALGVTAGLLVAAVLAAGAGWFG